MKETFQLRPLISQSRAARLQEGCPQRNHLMGKGEQENPSELPAVDVCSLCYQDCTVFSSRAVWSAPHCICSWDRTTVRPVPRGPRCSGAPLSKGGCHNALPYTEPGLPLRRAQLPDLGHNSVPPFLGHRLLIKRTKAYHYKKSSTHKDKHKERNKVLTKRSESKEQYGDKLLSINNYSKCK